MSAATNVNASAVECPDGKFDVFFDFKDAERRVVHGVQATSARKAKALVAGGFGFDRSKFVEFLYDADSGFSRRD